MAKIKEAFWTTKDVRDRITRAAKRDRRSKTKWLEMVVIEAVEQYERVAAARS